jgi:hypothetical protein
MRGITLIFGICAAASLVAVHAQDAIHGIEGTGAVSNSHIDIARVKPIDLTAPAFRLGEGLQAGIVLERRAPKDRSHRLSTADPALHRSAGARLSMSRWEPQRGVGVDRIPLDPKPSDQNAMTISTIFHYFSGVVLAETIACATSPPPCWPRRKSTSCRRGTCCAHVRDARLEDRAAAISRPSPSFVKLFR